MLVNPLLELGGKPEIRCEPIARALAAKNECLFRFTETCGRLRQRIKHGFEIEGRTADDLQHVGGGGLLLQRLAQIIRALAQLVEQASILDRDDGLGGEIADQLDLLVSKRAYLLAVDADGANQFLFLEHWNHKESSLATKLDHSDDSRIALPISRFHGEV